MKKWIGVIAAVLLLFCFSACGEKTYTRDDLAFYDTKTKQLIRLGDSRETIEGYIGEEKETLKEELGNTICEYEDYLTIWYDENHRAEHMSLFLRMAGKNNRFELPTGIGVHSSVTEFFEKYPDAVEEEYSLGFTATLRLKQKGDKYILDTSSLDVRSKQYSLGDNKNTSMYYKNALPYLGIIYRHDKSIGGIELSYIPSME